MRSAIIGGGGPVGQTGMDFTRWFHSNFAERETQPSIKCSLLLQANVYNGHTHSEMVMIV
jgi:hypothetical protein